MTSIQVPHVNSNATMWAVADSDITIVVVAVVSVAIMRFVPTHHHLRHVVHVVRRHLDLAHGRDRVAAQWARARGCGDASAAVQARGVVAAWHAQHLRGVVQTDDAFLALGVHTVKAHHAVDAVVAEAVRALRHGRRITCRCVSRAGGRGGRCCGGGVAARIAQYTRARGHEVARRPLAAHITVCMWLPAVHEGHVARRPHRRELFLQPRKASLASFKHVAAQQHPVPTQHNAAKARKREERTQRHAGDAAGDVDGAGAGPQRVSRVWVRRRLHAACSGVVAVVVRIVEVADALLVVELVDVGLR
eukprot:PhM_4_TR8345/c1_g1_i1/m.17835